MMTINNKTATNEA